MITEPANLLSFLSELGEANIRYRLERVMNYPANLPVESA
jgi:hypothetical protein